MALSPGGLALMFMMPIAGFVVSTKVDPRLLVSLGFLSLGATLHLMTIIYPGIDFKTIVILRVIQVMPMAFIFVPISTLNYIGVPREKNNQVSGMSNFARNIGGSIGTSLLNVFTTRQNQTHLQTFASHTSNGDPNFQNYLNGLQSTYQASGFDVTTAAQKALHAAYGTMQAQASALGFKNSFWVMSTIVLFLVPLPFVMRRPRPGEARSRGGGH